MARITIEDCMEHVPNRFHLVRMASIRAKQLKKGARPLLTSEENKEVVMSLREIAAGLIKPGNAEVPVAEPIAAPVAESVAEPLAASGPDASEAVEAPEAPLGETAESDAETPQEA